jgi:hypothetical protein
LFLFVFGAVDWSGAGTVAEKKYSLALSLFTSVLVLICSLLFGPMTFLEPTKGPNYWGPNDLFLFLSRLLIPLDTRPDMEFCFLVLRYRGARKKNKQQQVMLCRSRIIYRKGRSICCGEE